MRGRGLTLSPLFKPLPAASASLTLTHSLLPTELTRGGPLPSPANIHTATRRAAAAAAPPALRRRAAHSRSSLPVSRAARRPLAGEAAHQSPLRTASSGLRPSSRPSPSRTPQGGVKTAVLSHRQNLLLGPAYGAPAEILIGRWESRLYCEWAAGCP